MGQAPNHDENLHVPCADYCSAAWGWRMSGTTRVSTVRRVEKATFPEAARSLAANWPGRISGPREPVKRSFDRRLVLTFSRAGDGSLTGLASEPLNSPNLSYVRGPHNSARPFWVLPPNAPLHHGAQSRQGILRQCCPYHAKNSPRRLGQPSPVIAQLCRAAEQFLRINKAFQFAAGIEHWPSDRLRPSQPAYRWQRNLVAITGQKCALKHTPWPPDPCEHSVTSCFRPVQIR